VASLPIQIVDTNDRPVRAASKQEAWNKGLLHRIVRIVIEHPDGRLLLQRRSPAKDLFPDCWDNAVGGHVDVGEDYETAAYRELEEELGLTGQHLLEMGAYCSATQTQGHSLNRFHRTYKMMTDTLPDKLELGKVDEVRWFTLAEVKQLIREHPEHVADGLKEVVGRYYSKPAPGAYEPVVVVDDQDIVISEASLDDARKLGLIYRVVFVIAKDGRGRILLQKRGPDMHLYPDCWDVAAGGHVDGGRSYEAAARLELAEEIGIADTHLTETAHAYTDVPLWGGIASRRFATFFQITLDHLPTSLNAHEVSAVRWFTPQEIDELFAHDAEHLAEAPVLARKHHCL